MSNIEKLAQLLEDNAREFALLKHQYYKRKFEGDDHGCKFCRGTCWGEVDGEYGFACPEHNGLCL